MSIRPRPPSSQPPVTADPERAAVVVDLTEQFRGERGALLPALHAVMDRYGHISDDDVPVIAHVLNLSNADVFGVVTFYTDFRRTPPPPHRISLCRAEACQSVGSQTLLDTTEHRFAQSADVEVGEVFCLGNCALGPSGTIDGQLYGQLSSARITDLTKEW